MKLSNKDEIQYKFTVDSLPDHWSSDVDKLKRINNDGGYGNIVFDALVGTFFTKKQFENISNETQLRLSATKVANGSSKRMIECPEVGTGFFWSAMVKHGAVVPRYFQTDDRLCSDHWAEVYAKYDIKALAKTFGRDTITDARSHNTINEFDLRFGEVA
jgi:hypothetical protein